MFSQNQYQNIKKKCDKVLGFNPNIYLISNNSLNIIKAHPYHLRNYEFSILQNCIKLLINFIKFSFEIIISIKNLLKIKRYEEKTTDCLLICNLINIDSIKEKDYIYEDIEKILKKKFRVHKLFINQTSINSKKILGFIPDKKKSSIIGFDSPDLKFNLLSIINLLYYFGIYIIKSILYLDKTYLNIAFGFMDFSSKKNLNLMKNFSNLLNVIKYKNLIIPYEGYSWERLILMQSYQKNSNILRFGYNFSAFVKNQHSLLRRLKKDYEPDIIFTTGDYSKKKFKDFKIPIKSLGSSRYCKSKKKTVSKMKNINCIVVPEGIMTECLTLFTFSIKAALIYPHINFIWRLHPSMSFKDVIKNLKVSSVKQLPKNIIISNLKFFEDLSRSDIALYRGSTSIISAVQYGVFPVYYNNKENLDIDPIYEMKNWKLVVNDLKDFKKFEKKEYLNKMLKSKNKIRAQKFMKNYFQILKPKILVSQIIKSIKR